MPIAYLSRHRGGAGRQGKRLARQRLARNCRSGVARRRRNAAPRAPPI